MKKLTVKERDYVIITNSYFSSISFIYIFLDIFYMKFKIVIIL